MDENKFKGKLLGNLGEVFGIKSTIEIDEIDCWFNNSRNITLIINGGENHILCSNNLSELIREKKLDENTEELKKFSVYEFEDGKRYVTHLIKSIIPENYDLKVKRIEAIGNYLKLIEEQTKLISSGELRGEEFIEAMKKFKEQEKQLKAEMEKFNKLLNEK